MNEFEKEFPMFIDMVHDYNQNMYLFGIIDDSNHIEKCREFYNKHKTVLSEKFNNNDFKDFFGYVTSNHLLLSRNWHPERQGVRLSAKLIETNIK